MNPRMDRLTAHKTPFERDRFAESLAKVSSEYLKVNLNNILATVLSTEEIV